MPLMTKQSKKKGSLAKAVKRIAKRGPVWEGPESSGPQGGVTQSLLGRFLSCRARFRVLVVEGLKPTERWNPTMDFGSLWHIMEEEHAKKGGGDWPSALNVGVNKYMQKFPFQREEIECWRQKAAVLFPEYVKHWHEHPDVQARTPLLAEQVFHVPYKLPSGRTVYLRGKWDSVDAVEGGPNAGVWLMENKSKSTIDKQKIERQLRWDLQTLLYLVALEAYGWEGTEYGPPTKSPAKLPTLLPSIKGVRYNCVRRAAHKTAESMMEKFGLDSRNGRIEEWFCRWNVEVSAEDVARFKRESLDPILEQLCWWWDMIGLKKDQDEVAGKHGYPEAHYRMPYMYSPIFEGGGGEVDLYLDTGNRVGLTQADDLFPELK